MISDTAVSTAPILLIGYGNDLRGDDGAGRRIADAVKAWRRQDVRVISVHQLTPDLASEVARASAVIFVDAYLAIERDGVQVIPLEPTPGTGAVPSTGPVGHSGDPRRLLKIADALYGSAPAAWSVTIPAVRMGFGEQLSMVAERGVACALFEIARIIEERAVESTRTAVAA